MELPDQSILQGMKARIDHIEQIVRELEELGRGVPAVEKNSRIILSATYNLKFGVSDVAEIETE